MLKVIAFDFDGVIVDSNVLKKQAFFDAFSDLNPAAEKTVEEVLTYRAGKTRFDVIKQILVGLGKEAEIETIMEYAQKYNQKVQQGIIAMGLKDKVLETLEALSKKYILYINSATPEAALKESVKNLGIEKFFTDVYGRSMFEDFLVCKEINLKKIMNNQRVGGYEILMIGDDEKDYQAAKNCDCFFIGVSHKGNQWEKTAFPLVAGFEQLMDTIQKFS